MPAGSATEPIHVTMLGDSVADSLQYMPSAEQLLQRGYAVRFDLRVCRRLASSGCPFQGTVPSSALVAIRDDGSSLGDVLVVDVGYNDDPALYRAGMDQVIHAAHALGVKRVVWVTLRASWQAFRATNAVIVSEAKKFPQVTVADWNAWSAGKPWFRVGRASPHRRRGDRARSIPAPVSRPGGGRDPRGYGDDVVALFRQLVRS